MATNKKKNELFALASQLLPRRRRTSVGLRIPDKNLSDEQERLRLRAEYFKRVSEVEESAVHERSPIAALAQRD